jgi:hypothetical protein
LPSRQFRAPARPHDCRDGVEVHRTLLTMFEQSCTAFKKAKSTPIDRHPRRN